MKKKLSRATGHEPRATNHEPRTAGVNFNAEAQSRGEAGPFRSTNGLSTVVNRGGGGLKENPPCTPLKENKGRNSISTVPGPGHIARTYAPAQGTPPSDSPGPGSVKTDVGSPGPGPSQSRRRPAVDSEFILHGYNAQGLRYDAVQTAMVALGIPKESNGYHNARIMRYYLKRLGEDRFRDLVYQQWRENEIDGAPRNVTAAFMDKLYYADRGGAK